MIGRMVKSGAMIVDLPWAPVGDIIDPFAGKQRWWIGTRAKVTYVDRYYNAPNTVCASVTNLPFGDSTFDQAWADPPHFIRKSPLKTSRFGAENKRVVDEHGNKSGDGRCYFGSYPSRGHLLSEWRSAATELHRVTKHDGYLVWKSITGAKSFSSCCDAADLWFSLTPLWALEDFAFAPSRVTWSSAVVIYSRWRRRDRRVRRPPLSSFPF